MTNLKQNVAVFAAEIILETRKSWPDFLSRVMHAVTETKHKVKL